MIEIKNVSKSFEGKILFNNFSMIIPDGAFKVFAGKSGCGKTTLLNMIGGLERPDSGKILVNGFDIYERRNMKQYFTYQVGFLFQNFALIEEDTVAENLKYVQTKARSSQSIDEILEHIGLIEKKDVEVYKLSGGEQQRVALARLMFKQCNIILADEPTGSLDSENEEVVMNVLHDLNNKGKTVILVTHNEKIIAKEEDSVYL